MSLQIYNTLTGQKEEFKPTTPNNVKMYVCGVTVYDYCHLGHGRAYVAFDIINRYLKYLGYDVKYVRNITDIDDKIIARANENKDTTLSLKEKVSFLTSKYIDEFHKDTDTLNLLPPTSEPKATEFIPQMIEIIKKLIEKELAYVIGGDVYYDVGRFDGYGKLSKRSTDELLVGARVEPDPRKKSPLDFSLWKEAKPNEPYWGSPWGNGRPGWHLECSAMSLNLLGEEFDIHGGGQDLIFPHHENEIAQSCGYTGKMPVHYWIHNGFVTINKEKMSKSLGNFFTLRDIFKKYSGNIVRFFLLGQHYRSPVDFSDQLLEDAKNAIGRIEGCLRKTRSLVETKIDQDIIGNYKKKFTETMNDDFNTARALAVIFDIVKDINNDFTKNEESINIYSKVQILKEISEVLGINYNLAETISVQRKDEIELNEELLRKKVMQKYNDALIAELLCARNFYRRKKQWNLADLVRKNLDEKGYIIRDSGDKTECIKKEDI